MVRVWVVVIVPFLFSYGLCVPALIAPSCFPVSGVSIAAAVVGVVVVAVVVGVVGVVGVISVMVMAVVVESSTDNSTDDDGAISIVSRFIVRW